MSSVTAPGGDVTYTVTVTNTSSPSQGVTITKIDDDKFGVIWDTATDSGMAAADTTCDTELGADGRYLAAATDSFSCTFVGSVTGNAGDTHTNIVTGSGVDDLDNPVSDTGTESVRVIADQVTVTIQPGSCYYDGGSFTPVTVTIDPDSGATVELKDGSTVVATFSGTGGSEDLAPGTYDVVVTTADNFELVGDVPETVTVGECAPGAISVDKDASVSSVTAPGGDVTYTVTVTNTSSPSQGVTITKIDDDKFGVIWDTATDSGMAAADTTCDTELGADGRYLAAATDSFSCTFVGSVTGNAGDTHTNIVTGSGVDDLDNPVSDTGTESVRVIADQVTVTIQPGSCYYDGGSFTPVTVTIDPDSGATVELKDGSTVVASFSGTGGSEDLAPGTYDVVVTTADNFELVGDVPETVTVGECAPGAISVDKDASVSSVTAPGGDVTYTVTVTNTSSPSQGVTITKIDDDKFGVIWDTATDSGMAAADTTCDTELGADGRYLAAATDSFSCTFVGSVTGNAGDTHTNIVTGSGVDDLDNPVSDTGTESVRVIADQVTVTIQPGSCYYDGGSFTPVTVTIDPDSGATVELKDGSTVVATFSGTGGSEDLAPGTYDVVVTTADNFELVGDVPETVTVGDCTPPPTTTTTTRPAATGSIGDYVWLDANADGHQGDFELPLEGVKVELLDSNGAVLATTTTNANGGYLFDGLAAGTYQVRFTIADDPNDQTNLTFGPALADGVPVDRNSDATDIGGDDADDVGVTGSIFLQPGQDDLTWDAGVIAVAVQGIQIESTTTTIAPVTTDTLPFTGFESQELAILGLVVLAAGGMLLFTAARREDEEAATETTGTWSSL